LACYELSNSAKEITYESSVKKIGTGIVTLTVFLFAIFIICDFTFGSYFVCMLLPIGFIMTSAGFQHESDETKKVSPQYRTGALRCLRSPDPAGL